jgi:hypothetical protein
MIDDRYICYVYYTPSIVYFPNELSGNTRPPSLQYPFIEMQSPGIKWKYQASLYWHEFFKVFYSFQACGFETIEKEFEK